MSGKLQNLLSFLPDGKRFSSGLEHLLFKAENYLG